MKKILVIDDEPDVADLMRLFLENLGYEADIFHSCEDFLKAVDNNEYWMVFCDYMMPGCTGDKLYSRLKDAGSNLVKRFVIITGAVMEESLDSFLETEDIRILNKPFGFDDVKGLILEVEKL